ncbi:toll/interleukin-1 receptor domain-containing protein [Rhizobium lusitanum]|uniref:TIR domain-containing protein n=1 Tax=Rhizobium lusitanum TaxID=293958 RepID=A0A7X0MEX7_9HYPH|nr:toll/interleukin-1 receptor domain-containing protein [Rhizobium lusitanum]MBB6487941.1 hypothetical protein [Rhizobium lusitanum]
MKMTYNGRPFDVADFARDIDRQMLESVKVQIRERFASIRNPETGEFPTVLVHGERLDDIRLTIEGSPEILELVKKRMSLDDQDAVDFVPLHDGPPRAFLSYSFEDRDLAKAIATGLMANGVDTWWAEWEIGLGDSLRRKIDDGLGKCSHFIVLLTPNAMERPWVQEEMDAGLVRQISGQARFIPLRHGLTVLDLPPLLSGKYSPEIDVIGLDQNIRDIANDIHGISRKPILGPAPSAIELPPTDYSKTATAIAKVFVEGTQTALFADPQMTVEELTAIIEVSEEDVEDALHELRDFVNVTHRRVLPQADLFAQFDKYFMAWSPEQDALRIAADLINDPEMPYQTGLVADRYGWNQRRMNPALAYLLARNLIVDYRALANDFATVRVVKTEATRRFVRSRS